MEGADLVLVENRGPAPLTQALGGVTNDAFRGFSQVPDVSAVARRLMLDSKSLRVVGINYDRNQAPFLIIWNAVHNPCPEGIGSAVPWIGPCSRNVIIVPCKASRSFARLMSYRSNHRNNSSSMLFQPLHFIYLINDERTYKDQSPCYQEHSNQQ